MHVQHRFAHASLFSLAQTHLLFHPGQALQIPPELAQGSRDVVTLDGPEPFSLPALLLAALVGLIKQMHHLFLQLLQGGLELGEIEHLALHPTHTSFQVFEDTGLILQLAPLIGDPLL